MNQILVDELGDGDLFLSVFQDHVPVESRQPRLASVRLLFVESQQDGIVAFLRAVSEDVLYLILGQILEVALSFLVLARSQSLQTSYFESHCSRWISSKSTKKLPCSIS